MWRISVDFVVVVENTLKSLTGLSHPLIKSYRPLFTFGPAGIANIANIFLVHPSKRDPSREEAVAFRTVCRFHQVSVNYKIVRQPDQVIHGNFFFARAASLWCSSTWDFRSPAIFKLFSFSQQKG